MSKYPFVQRPSQKCLITCWFPVFPVGTNLTPCFFLHIVYCGLQSQGLPVSKCHRFPHPLQLAPEVQEKTNRENKVSLRFSTALQIHEFQLFSLRFHPLLNVYVV